MILLAAYIRSSRFLNLDKRTLCSPPAHVFEVVLTGNLTTCINEKDLIKVGVSQIPFQKFCIHHQTLCVVFVFMLVM